MQPHTSTPTFHNTAEVQVQEWLWHWFLQKEQMYTLNNGGIGMGETVGGGEIIQWKHINHYTPW